MAANIISLNKVFDFEAELKKGLDYSPTLHSCLGQGQPDYLKDRVIVQVERLSERRALKSAASKGSKIQQVSSVGHDISHDDELSCFSDVQAKYLTPRVALAPCNQVAVAAPAAPAKGWVDLGNENVFGPPPPYPVYAAPKLVVKRKPVPQLSLVSLPRQISDPGSTSPQILRAVRVAVQRKAPPPLTSSTTPFGPAPFFVDPLTPRPQRIVVTPLPKPAPIAPRPDVSIEDFSLRFVLGKGAQGKVYLAIGPARYSDKLFAVKVQNKAKMPAKYIAMMLQEQRILKQIAGHPFLLQMNASFHDTQNFYLVMNFCGGGDLQNALYRDRVFTLERTQFYASELVLGIQYLHKHGIIHRDLKLANVFLQPSGHISIGDFGLCKLFGDDNDDESQGDDEDHGDHKMKPEHTKSFCGTITYMAPEALQGIPYTYSVDWWALGIITYAMLRGDVPWTANSKQEVKEMVIEDDIPWEDGYSIDKDAKNFIDGLLEKNPHRRMGASAIFEHPFFQEVNWNDVEMRNVSPPHVPEDSTFLAYGALDRKDQVQLGRHFFNDPHPAYNYIDEELRLDLENPDRYEAEEPSAEASPPPVPTPFSRRGPILGASEAWFNTVHVFSDDFNRTARTRVLCALEDISDDSSSFGAELTPAVDVSSTDAVENWNGRNILDSLSLGTSKGSPEAKFSMARLSCDSKPTTVSAPPHSCISALPTFQGEQLSATSRSVPSYVTICSIAPAETSKMETGVPYLNKELPRLPVSISTPKVEVGPYPDWDLEKGEAPHGLWKDTIEKFWDWAKGAVMRKLGGLWDIKERLMGGWQWSGGCPV